MGRHGIVATFVVLGVALLALGLWRDAWWPLAGGVGALSWAAWQLTEEDPA